MRSQLEELLGIDSVDPLDKLASDLVEADEQLLDALVRARIDSGLNQGQVAERMGISQSAVARIESGERNPHLSTLRRYAHAVRQRVEHSVTPMDAVSVVGVSPYSSQVRDGVYRGKVPVFKS